MTKSFILRPSTAQDADAVLECLHVAFEPFRHFYSKQGFEDTTLTPATIHRRLADFHVLVAQTPDGQIIGTIACNISRPQEGHLRGMAVMPDFQGCGVAEALLLAAEERLRGLGCLRVSLDTTAPLQRAIRFYEKHGYRASGVVGDFYGLELYEYVKEFALCADG